MQQHNIWHIAKYQDNKNNPNLCKRPNTANVHFHFPLRNLQSQTCGLIYKFHEEMHDIGKCWQRLEQWFSSWGWFAFFLRVVRASDPKYSYLLFYFIFLMELLFVIAKIIGSPGKNDSLLFHSKLF